MSTLSDFWTDMPWYGKLSSIALLALIYVVVIFARQVPASVDALDVKLEAHTTTQALTTAGMAIDIANQKEKTEESLKLLRSMCVSLALMAKTDQTKCF